MSKKQKKVPNEESKRKKGGYVDWSLAIGCES
jgi:hypothetical protein